MRHARKGLVLVVSIASLLSLGVLPAGAQSPYPSQYAESRNDISYPNSVPYITTVQGDDFCSDKGGNANALSELENISNQLLANGKAVISEITITTCNSISTYESDVSALEQYIDSHEGDAGQKWLGVMLDEEHYYGIPVSSLEALNSYTNSIMGGSAGNSYYFTETGAGCGDYSQGDYNAIAGSGAYPAPQVYNSCEESYVNNTGFNGVTVTWWTGANSGYNSEAGAVGSVNRSPRQFNPYNSGGPAYIGNEFIAS